MFSFFSRKKRHPLSVFIYNLFKFYPNQLYLYELAFTHKSASVHYTKDFSINNERLEFLGDSVLNTIISEYLYEEFPNEQEGFLTNLRSKMVSRYTLNEIASHMQIDKRIKHHYDKRNSTTNIYGNALEALIGAIFLDKGYEITKKVIIQNIVIPYIDIQFLIENDTNYKGQLIDWAQKHHYTIEFINSEILLPNKQHGFCCDVYINNEKKGSGKGLSKKNAEQEAAKQALQKIQLS